MAKNLLTQHTANPKIGTWMQHIVWEQRQGGVALVPHAAVDEAESQQRAGLDVLVSRVQVLVDGGQTTVYIPQVNHTQGGGRW